MVVHTTKDVDNPPWWQRTIIPLLLFAVVFLLVVNISLAWRRNILGAPSQVFGTTANTPMDERLDQVGQQIEALTKTLEALRGELRAARAT